MASANTGLTAWARIAAPFREFGLGVGALYVVDRLCRRLSPTLGLQVYELLAQPVSDQPLLPARRSVDLSYEELGPGHPKLSLLPVPADVIATRFRQGARCLAGYRGQRMIGYLWWCERSYDEDEVRCTYVLDKPAPAVFDFDFYIFPEHRMGSAFLALWQGANAWLSRDGKSLTYSRMTRFNLASRRAHQRLGARRIGWACFASLGRLQVMVSNLRPFAFVSWGSDQRVRLTLPEAPRMAALPIK